MYHPTETNRHLSKVLFLAASALVGSAFAPALGRGHNFEPLRAVYLSIDPDSIDALVDYRVPAGDLSERITGAIDLNRDGRVQGPMEELARVQVLGTRAQSGLGVSWNHRPLTWLPDTSEFVPQRGRGGWRARIAYGLERSGVSTNRRRCDSVEFTVAVGTAPVRLHAEIAPELELIEGIRPRPATAIALAPGSSIRWCLRH